jgi:UDP:flavonoid glycosyltransferase YjiC (YdhE family)
MGKLWEFSDGIILPDLPPPYTISEKNLWGSNVEKIRYVGFLAPSDRGEADEAAKEFIADNRPKIFWQVSGPPQTRGSFLAMALECSKALARKYAFAVSAGNPMGRTTPIRFGGGWFYEWCGIPQLYFARCDVVISRAGHGTIGQAILASKPSLLVPIPKQPEQEGNAEKAARLGVSLVLPQDELSVENVSMKVDRLLGESFSTSARILGNVARNFDAKSEIVSTLEAAASGARRGPG